MSAGAASPPLDRASQLACLAAAAAAILPLATLLPAWTVGVLLVLLAAAALTLWRRLATHWVIRLPLTAGMTALVLLQYGVGMGGGFGRDTAAALLAVMLLLKLLELRSVRDGRAVLSFSLFAILAAFLQDQGPMILTLALAGILLVLAAMARLAEVETPGEPLLQALAVPSRLQGIARLAALSVPLAMVGFFLFPRLASPLWALPQNSNEARTGLSDNMSPGDISSLYLDDTPVMRVRFDVEPLIDTPLYWRGPVLSQFDGRGWNRSGFLSALDAPELEATGPALTYEIEQEPTERRFVFALDLVLAPQPGQRITGEWSLIADRPLIRVSRLTLRSQPSYRLQSNMQKTLKDWYRSLPENYNPRTRARIAEWRAEGADDAEVIRRALAWFNADFRYTLNPILLGRDSVDDFLFNTQAGYCEHFASAFAVMMRAAGIPARVVTGYQGGYRNPIGDYLVILQSDAHAWTEVWLEDQGWVRIDPTSAIAPGRIDQGVDAPTGASRLGGAWGQPLFDAVDWLRRGWNNVVLGFDFAQQSRLLQPFGIAEATWRQLAIALIVAAAIALAITMALLLRPARGARDAVGRAYARFLARIARRGHVKPRHEGAIAFAERIATNLPASSPQILALSQRYARQRYAPPVTNPQVERDLCTDLTAFRIAPEDRP